MITTQKVGNNKEKLKHNSPNKLIDFIKIIHTHKRKTFIIKCYFFNKKGGVKDYEICFEKESYLLSYASNQIL